ncbi:MAG: ATP-binding cassette domain-containing protein [Gammaproteobacteria bacterium]|nr:ATP-binding cassette domain-containing protein [Gammaproteobacteria bacterium]
MTKSTITLPEHFRREHEKPQGYKPEVLKGILGFIAPYKNPLLISLGLMLIGSIASVAGPYFTKIALDEGIVNQNRLVLRNAILLYLLTALLQWIVTYIRVNVMARAGQSAIYDMRARLFNHIQDLSLSFFSHYSAGRLVSRVINDVTVLRQFVTWAIIASFRNILTVFGIVIAMISMNLKLSLLTISVLPLIVIATFVFRNRIRDIYRRVRAGMSWVNSVLAENINGVRVIQAFSRQDQNYAYFQDQVNRFHLENNLQAARLVATFFPSIDMIGTIAIFLVIWLGGAAVIGEQVTAGVLVAFVLYIEQFFRPIQDLSRRYDQFQSSMIAGERILELLDSPIEVQDHPNANPIPPIDGRVVFKNVSFYYKDDPETLVLEDINLYANPGQSVALVGETGAGKSTLIKLLGRFYDPTSGNILIDGQNIQHVTQSSLRGQMGIVLQEPFLFGGTVFENIQFGHLEATLDDVQKAAIAVGAHEFISNLTHGYHTPVEEGGALLSVGQRQLISFARALLANPRILILDEATSSIDTQTEQIIQQALSALLTGRTSFVIAHRLSTIVNADWIVVMDQGKIVEQGIHEDLLKMKGIYYNLYNIGFQEPQRQTE